MCSRCVSMCCRKQYRLILRAVVKLQSLWRMCQARVRYLGLLAEEARRIAEEEEEECRRRALEEEEKERRWQEEQEQLVSTEHQETTAGKPVSPSAKKSMAVFHLEIPASLAFTLHCMEGWCEHPSDSVLCW